MRERIGWALGLCAAVLFVGSALGQAATAEQRQEQTYLEIELVGEFGREITARGVDLALRAAARQSVERAVVHLDSFGGDIDDARAVADVLASHRRDFELHIIARRAIGEAMWVLIEADELWVEETSEIGPGVVIDPPQIGVPRTVNNDDAVALAELTRRAAMRGFPREIILAASLTEESLWYSFDPASGAARFLTEQSPGAQQLVGPNMVLALTGREMISFALAQRVPEVEDADGRLPQFGRAVSGQRWLRQGASDLTRLDSRRDRMLERYEATVNTFSRQESWVQGQRSAAARNRSSSPFVHPGVRQNSRQIRERRARIDEAIAAWDGVLRGLAELRILEGRLDRYWRDYQRVREQIHQARMLHTRFVPDPPPSINRSIDTESIEREARNAIGRLRHERNQG